MRILAASTARAIAGPTDVLFAGAGARPDNPMMPSSSEPLLFRGGAVFDAADRRFRPNTDVFCRDGLITAIGIGLHRDGAMTVDCSGLFIIPGLIDCHVHLTSSGEGNELNTAAADPTAVRAWRAAKYAATTLRSGVTTVRDLGAAERVNIHMAKAIEDGLIEGPRMLAAGLGVTMTGGHGHGFLAREADGPDEVRKAVREQLRAGASTIKLFASGGVLTPGVDPRSPSFTEDELRAGVEEAHKAFRIVGAHAQSTDGVKNAIRAGVDSIEHGVWLDEEAIELMLARGTYLVATLSAPYHIAMGGLEAGLPAYAVDKAHQVLDDHRASFRLAVKSGVKIAMGTDEGTPLNRPGENATEIVRMVEQGLSPSAALMASTAWGANLLRLDGVCGRVAAGLAADLLVLRSDPLADIAVLTRPDDRAAVIQRGRVVISALQGAQP
jgi:imidazolonepropionase-like amidohydrolase